MRAFSFLAVSLVLCLPALAGVKAKRPNVLLICVDDLKPLLGCYGDPIARTPNIDRLAARGIRFESAYCNQAVCAPSRNNLMLGSRSTSLGIYNLSTNFRQAVPDAVTLTQFFMRHGWRAEGMGKILHVGHGNTNDAASWSVPFYSDKLVEYVDPAHRGPETREEALFNNRKGPVASLPRGYAWESPDVPDTAYADGRVAEEASRRLRAAKAKPDEPLFLAVGFVRPHLPFSVPKRYWDLYDRTKMPLATRPTPPDGAPAYAGKTTLELNQYEPVPERGAVPDDMQRALIHGYYASVSFSDAQIGRVLDELDRTGLADHTIILLWGDHGWHLGDHGMWTKHTNYEQAIRIPLLVVAPGVAQPGTRTRAMVETVDVFPTLCELAGLPPPRDVPQPMDGRSLVPVLRNPATSLRDHIYHVFPRNRGSDPVLGRAIRSARHRLVEWKQPGAPPDTADLELYDYEADPGETRNLAAQQPQVVARMRALLASHPEAKPPLRPAAARQR
ncbi:MAG: sulfatase [Opitutaceae bacterium]|nr:sulfatase [Opitutaceae bacterium]